MDFKLREFKKKKNNYDKNLIIIYLVILYNARSKL